MGLSPKQIMRGRLTPSSVADPFGEWRFSAFSKEVSTSLLVRFPQSATKKDHSDHCLITMC